MSQNHDAISLVGIKELARRLDVPVSWLYHRTRKNKVPYYRLGKYLKFREDEVMEWVRSQQESGGGDAS